MTDTFGLGLFTIVFLFSQSFLPLYHVEHVELLIDVYNARCGKKEVRETCQLLKLLSVDILLKG